MNPRVKQLLGLLRLTDVNQGVFVRATPAMQSILAQAAEFITWGCPDKKAVASLIYKRGYALNGDKNVPLSDNKFIEDSLSKIGIVCLEDIVHEITTVGSHFRRVNSWLSVFFLAKPKGGWANLKETAAKGGDLGRRTPEQMTKLLQKIT